MGRGRDARPEGQADERMAPATRPFAQPAESSHTETEVMTDMPNTHNSHTTPSAQQVDLTFANRPDLQALPDGFSIPGTVNACAMFHGCSSLKALPKGFSAPNVVNAYDMFHGCSSLSSLPEGFSIPNVTDARHMFAYCGGLTALPDGFSAPNVTDADCMFNGEINGDDATTLLQFLVQLIISLPVNPQ